MATGDVELLRAWRAGDMQSGELLFERYYDQVARFFRNKLSSDIADLVQETFTACVVGRDRLQEDTSFRGYLFSVARNILCRYLRSRYRGGDVIDLQEQSVADLAPGPITLIARRREHRLLLEALRKIPLDYQMLLELRYWEQLKTADIALSMDIPHGTVRTRLRRARELLNQAMSKLASDEGELESTLANFDQWAWECRNLAVVKDEPSGS